VPVIIGLGVGVLGVYAARQALVDEHSELWEFLVADSALGIQGAALIVLLVYHIYEMTGEKPWVAWCGGGLVAVLLTMVTWAITHP
jgi:hypothetical protein